MARPGRPYESRVRHARAERNRNGGRVRGAGRAVTTYIDSSALVAVYVPERHSAAAHKTLRKLPQVPYTLLHELEVANAFALLLGRKSITAVEYRAILAQVRDDVEAQRLMPTALDWPQTFAGACELSEACSPSARCLCPQTTASWPPPGPPD
jgi:predicted nucleic acid-binding protein